MEPRLKAFRCGTARQRSACCVDTTQPTAVRRNIPQRAVYITFTTRKTTREAGTHGAARCLAFPCERGFIRQNLSGERTKIIVAEIRQ